MSERKDEINQRLDAEQQGLLELEQMLAEAETELNALSSQSEKYLLLQRAADSIKQLQEHQALELFWGEEITPQQGADHIERIEQQVAHFNQQVGFAEDARARLAERVGGSQQVVGDLSEDLYELQMEEEDRLNEWVVEREEDSRPAAIQVMPWMRGFEEDQRFRKTLAASLCISLFLALVIPLIDIPLPEREELIEVPERFVKMIQKREKKPPQVAARPIPPEPKELEPPKPEPVPDQKPEKTAKVADNPAPAVHKEKSAREKVAAKGILAFRESFSNLADSRPSAKLGAQASINNSGSSKGRPERKMVTTQASGSSGGINLSSLSRGVGGGGGGGDMAGVVTTQVASSIGGPSGSDRPLSAGASAGRTDEEIQIVFDRYKASLYRLYNRELRKDPTLRGQMVIQLTIEPDGSVSACSLQRSSMGAPDLAEQVVARVSGFNFGPKEVPVVTIVYPIDFLPAA